MLALSSNSSLRVFAMNLVLGQVCEADADGGQSLSVVCLHDVAQEPHPELLGQEWGEEGPEPVRGVLHPCPELVRLHPQCGLYLASQKLSQVLNRLSCPPWIFFRGIRMASTQPC